MKILSGKVFSEIHKLCTDWKGTLAANGTSRPQIFLKQRIRGPGPHQNRNRMVHGACSDSGSVTAERKK